MRDHVILQAADATYDIRAGDWKLVERANPPEFTTARNAKKAANKKSAATKPDELFNLQADPAETTDVRATNTDRAAQLKAALTAARDRGFTRPGAGN